MRSSIALAVAAALAVGLFAAGCNEGHGDAGAPDLAVAADLSAAPDLTAVDLKGPSCGQIFLCVLQMCQLTNLMCDQTCFQGAQPQALQEAGALALCAGTNCLGGLLGDGGLGGLGGGGGGGPGLGQLGDIIMCIETKCPDQTNACEDLPFAGAPM